MNYDKSTRLLTALGAGFKCSQRLLEEPKIFLGEVRGNKEAEEVLEKLAADYFLSPGAPQDGFRALRAEVSKVVGIFCHKRGNECSVNLQPHPESGTDTCEAPRIFCTRALACAEKHSRGKLLNLDGQLFYIGKLLLLKITNLNTEKV